jgi:hypothetical protein
LEGSVTRGAPALTAQRTAREIPQDDGRTTERLSIEDSDQDVSECAVWSGDDKMIICPYEFNNPDPDDPTYSMLEVDYYAWTPVRGHSPMPNHRLSLRKNLVTNTYEVYRQYVQAQAARLFLGGQSGVLITMKEGKYEEIALSTKDIKEAVRFANSEYEKYHNDEHDDEVCDETGDRPAMLCDGACKSP